MEAMPMVSITQDATVKFLQSIIYRFGVSKWVLTNNWTQFKGAKFASCYADFNINHQDSSVAHPQMNGQVKRANILILQGMNTMNHLEARGRNWHMELPLALWALHTNVNQATRDTPFHLVYRVNAVLPSEIFFESARIAQLNKADQDEARELDSNLIEEKRNKALANV
jgi:transposase InsO family protein